VSRGDVTDTEWHILNPLLPDRGERGPAVANKRRTATASSGFCAPARRGATCQSDTAFGIQSSCASLAGASLGFGTRSSRDWLLLGHRPTRSMPSIRPSCGRTSMQPVQKVELHDANADKLLGDKGYDSDEIRDDLAERGIEPVIPPRSNRKKPTDYDRNV
jgi:transposase